MINLFNSCTTSLGNKLDLDSGEERVGEGGCSVMRTEGGGGVFSTVEQKHLLENKKFEFWVGVKLNKFFG